MEFTLQLIGTIAILLIFSLWSYGKKLLDIWGILAADIFGALAFSIAGFRSFLALLLLYICAVIATKIGRIDRQKHETRTIANIAGNGGPAIIFMLLGSPVGFFGAISAALADTFSSEIGMNSMQKPVMITTLRPVEKGTDGAVSVLGLGASVAGAAIIAGTYYLLVSPSQKMLLLLVLTGVLGSIIDSVLGATLQRRGVLGNNQVNFIASSAGAVAAVLVSGAL